MYRDELTARLGPLADGHPANFVLVALCAMEDDGLLILPTHRLLIGLDTTRAAAVLQEAKGVDAQPTAPNAPDPIEPGAFRIYDGATDRAWTLRADGEQVLATLAPQRSLAWQRLDVAVLHYYLIDQILRPLTLDGGELDIRYVKDAAEGRRSAREDSALLVEMAPTSLTQLSDVCRAGELMPPKSTYFYPKLTTGLLIHSLAD
jgi:hypothetical protein